MLLRRYLRGRYVIAGALAAILSIPAAIAGHFAAPPIYTSTGLVRVAPTMPKVLYQNEENQLLPMFDSYVAAQTDFLQSPRVLQRASRDEALAAAGWPSGPAAIGQLASGLEVKLPRGSQIISVSMKNRNPALAQAGVNAVLASYEAVEDELNGTSIENRETTLIQRAKDLQNQLTSLRQQILQLSEERGTDDLEAMNAAKVSAVVQLDNSIAELDLQIARATSSQMGPNPGPEGPSAEALAALGASDPLLRELLDQQEKLRVQYASLTGKLAPTHRTMEGLQRQLDAVAFEITARTKELAASSSAGSANPSGASRTATGVPPLGTLLAMRESQEKLRIAAVEELKNLGRTRLTIRALRERADEVKRDLDEANTRLDQMRVERQNIKTGRVTVVQRGDLPVSPSTDRRVPFTVFGGLLGFSLGLGLVWGYGFLRDGYRYVDDLERGAVSAPILGIIPDLSHGLAQDEQQAAISVHHIRNALRLQTCGAASRIPSGESPRVSGQVFTVTSAMAGDGKTHLSLALGLSFAMAGRRTLLVDADLVGRGLSAELGLDRAPGLSEAIGVEALNGEVHPTRENLWAIPAGTSTEFRPEKLSTELLQRLLFQARGSFDTIIVDSGPIMGSLEANIASSLSDRVVLVVSRGQNPKLVKAALDRLRNVGATCAGVVFNRAIPKDFLQSASVVSTSSRFSSVSGRSRQPSTKALAGIMNRDRNSSADPPRA